MFWSANDGWMVAPSQDIISRRYTPLWATQFRWRKLKPKSSCFNIEFAIHNGYLPGFIGSTEFAFNDILRTSLIAMAGQMFKDLKFIFASDALVTLTLIATKPTYPERNVNER